MKKLTGLLTVLVLALFLTACGDEEATRTFVIESDGVLTTMVYTSTDDKVTKQSTENIIRYDLSGLSSKEEAQQIFDPMIEQFQNIKGIAHTMKYEDSKAIETLSIDYKAVNFDDIEGLPGMSFSEDPRENGISMEKSAELLLSQGFTEK